MEKFVILGQARQGEDMKALKEVSGFEERAVNEAMRIFRLCGMQKVIVVDANIAIRFKDTRVCRCTNVQIEYVAIDIGGELVQRDVCMDCKIVIDPNAWVGGVDKIEEMISEN